MDLMTATDDNDYSKHAGGDQMDEGSNEGHESPSDAAAEKRRASRIELSENEGQKLMRLLDDALVTPLEDEVV